MCVKSYKETKQEKIQNLNEQMYYDSREHSDFTDESFRDSENDRMIEESDDIHNSDWEDV